MNPVMYRAVILALAVALLGGIASGQHRVIANIPFAFQTTAERLPAGNYDIAAGIGATNHLVRLRHIDTNKSYLLQFNTVNAPFSGNESARLVFQCDSGNCWLNEVWPGFGLSGCALKAPKGALGKRFATVTINLKSHS